MRNNLDILDDLEMWKINGNEQRILPLWVYATLRDKQKYNYYLTDCSSEQGEYQMDGTLMRAGNGDVFVLKDDNKIDSKAKPEQKVVGELFDVSLIGLARIFHLENQSGTFPKAYDLDVSEVSNKAGDDKKIVLWFRRWEEKSLENPDYCDYKSKKPKTILEDLVDFFKGREMTPDRRDIDGFLRGKLPTELVKV